MQYRKEKMKKIDEATAPLASARHTRRELRTARFSLGFLFEQ
jgi:hypothetical protein